MGNRFFWNDWNKTDRIGYLFFLSFVAIVAAVYLWCWAGGYDVSIDWLVNGSLTSVAPVVDGISGLSSSAFEFTSQLFLVNQKVLGSGYAFTTISVYLYLIFVTTGLVVCLAVSSFLPRFWFMVAMGLLMVLLISLRLELIGLFGIYDQTVTVSVFALFAGVSYYFNSVKPGASLIFRIVVFSAVTALLAVLIFFFSKSVSPFLIIASYAFIPFLLIAILFVLLVSHEVVYGILRISTGSSVMLNSNNTKHFVVLSLVYLLNIAMVQMRNSGFIDWDIYYVDVFVVFLISSVIGVWGVRSREVLYYNILPFYPYTAFLYLGVMMCCFGFISFHFYEGNDLVIEVIEDAIVFGHLGFGAMFFIYIIANFINYLLKNLPVYKIAYKEDNFPYFTSRLAGLIVVAALYYSSNEVPKYQGIGAFYSGMGDMYQRLDNSEKAKAMYAESAIYGVNNHKANYNLGMLEVKADDRITGFDRATQKKPSAFAYANLGLEYESEGKFFDALFAYQKGLSVYPDNAALKNNLAMMYGKTHVLDSTLYYLTQLSSGSFMNEVILANLLSVSATHQIDYLNFVDSARIASNERYDVGANAIAHSIVTGKGELPGKLILPTSSRLNLIKYAYVNNLALWAYSHPEDSDTALRVLDSYLMDEQNTDYKERLLFLKALVLYVQGHVGEAFSILKNLTHTSSIPGYYSTLLGVWSIQQGQPKLAFDFFDIAEEHKLDITDNYKALTLAMMGSEGELADLLVSMRSKGDSSLTYQRIEEAMEMPTLGQKQAAVNRKHIDRMIENARDLTAKGNLAEAEKIYSSLGAMNPFHDGAVLAVADFYSQKDETKAYDVLVKAIDINPYSENLIKRYIDQCFAMNLVNYAETGLLMLLDVMDKQTFSAYEQAFDLRKAEVISLQGEWVE